MTAILGYADSGVAGRPAQSLLVADDLEGDWRSDKVLLLGRRFAVSAAGNGALGLCLEFLIPFCQSSNQESIDSAEALASNLQRVIAQFMPWLHDQYRKAVQSGKMSAEGLRMLEAQRDACVVLDCSRHKLWFIDCGQIFSEKGPPEQLIAVSLENNTAYGFARLSPDLQPRKYGQVEGLPWDLAKQEIEAAHKSYPSAVGRLGSSVECRDGEIIFSSCFKSPHDYVESKLKAGFLGFNVNVVCPKHCVHE